MSKPTTHVLMTLDDSASMNSLSTDTRGGFNSFIDGLIKDTEQKYRVTVAKFGSDYALMAKNEKPKNVDKLDERNYRAMQGSTSLYDAIGKLIGDFETNNELAEDDKVLLVVQTDGNENSSREFTLPQVKEMIETRQKTGRWSCLFLAAGPDAWRQGGGMGFAANSVIRTEATSKGTEGTYRGVTEAARSYSRGADADEVAAVTRGAVADAE